MVSEHIELYTNVKYQQNYHPYVNQVIQMTQMNIES